MTETTTPSVEEAKAIRSLQSLARRWPPSLWLFSANGTLNVMKLNKDGERAHHPSPDNGVDAAFSVATINIPNDGGDW